MATKKREIGADVEAFCAKCKADKPHVITTLKSDGNINRVTCGECEDEHLFRLPKGDGKKKPSKRRKKGAVAVSEADLKKAKPYKLDGVFKVGDIITHKAFGPGSVIEIRSGGKMDVGFEDGGKTLVCSVSSK